MISLRLRTVDEIFLHCYMYKFKKKAEIHQWAGHWSLSQRTSRRKKSVDNVHAITIVFLARKSYYDFWPFHPRKTTTELYYANLQT